MKIPPITQEKVGKKIINLLTFNTEGASLFVT